MKKTDQVKNKQPWVIITNGLYDFLKFFLLVIAPSSAAIYLWLSTIFRLPLVPWAVISYLLVTSALGMFLYLSSRSYSHSDLRYDGKMLVSQNEEGELLYSLELNDDPNVLRMKAHISFKVIDLRSSDNLYNDSEQGEVIV